MAAPDVPDLEAWLGRERIEEDVLGASQARRLAATLGRGPDELGEGAPLPPGWHWIYFGTPVPRARLGPDGHEALGAFLPDLPYSRRMWAGGTMRLERALHLGERATRHSTVEAITPKEGRSGPLVFVTVRNRITGPSGLAVDEGLELVYRPAAAGRPEGRTGGLVGVGAMATASGPGGSPSVTANAVEPSESAWSEAFVADEAMLFRFSALTFNAHRIHYDYPYATEVEGHPGLVVHGPLLALLLLEAGTRRGFVDPSRTGAAPLFFQYRARAPVFCHEPFRLEGADSHGTLRATHEGRGVLMEAELRQERRVS